MEEADTGGGRARRIRVVFDRAEQHIIVDITPKQKITYGPLASNGKFPACFRIYEGKQIVMALSGVTGFYDVTIPMQRWKKDQYEKVNSPFGGGDIEF